MVAELPKKAPTVSQGRHGSLKLDCYERCQKARDNTRLHRSRAMRSYGLAYSRGYVGFVGCNAFRGVQSIMRSGSLRGVALVFGLRAIVGAEQG